MQFILHRVGRHKIPPLSRDAILPALSDLSLDGRGLRRVGSVHPFSLLPDISLTSFNFLSLDGRGLR
jgi:hypothetical protein